MVILERLIKQKYIKEKQIEIFSKILENLFEDYTNTIDGENSERYYQLLSNLDKQNYSNEIFVENLSHKIKISDLETFIKPIK